MASVSSSVFGTLPDADKTPVQRYDLSNGSLRVSLLE